MPCTWTLNTIFIMRIKIIISFILFAILIALKLLIDLNLFFSGKINNHLIGPIIVCVVIAVCSFLSGWRSIAMWLFAFWAIFDSLYGVFIHQGIFYVGTTAKLDILQRKFEILLWLKYIGAIGSTLFFFLTFKNKQLWTLKKS